MKKASVIYSNIENNNEAELSVSKGWCRQFIRRNSLSLRRKVSVSQKDPEMVVLKLFVYSLISLEDYPDNSVTRCLIYMP